MSGTLRIGRSQLPHEQRQDRPEAAIDELQAEDDRHQQDEVLEREHVAERNAARRDPSPARGARARSSYIKNTSDERDQA